MPVQYETTKLTSNEIAARLERRILEGSLRPGDRLPTVRELARELVVSPATVAAAYTRLAQRGLTAGDRRRGTRVAPTAHGSAGSGTVAAGSAPAGARDLATGSPEPELLPDLARAMARLRGPASGYVRADDEELVAIAQEWFEADGIAARDIAIVSGAMDGVERVLAAHLRTGDRVVVEDPGYPAVFDVVAALGLVPVPVVVDDEGFGPGAFAAAVRGDVRAVVMTPRAHNPTGAALSASRKRALAPALATRPELLLVEDDHSGVVCGAGAVTLVPRGWKRWAVVRSVSKSHGPDLRLGMLTGDATTVARVRARQAVGPGWVSHILQRAVVALWRDRSTVALLRKAEATYASRRRALLDALARQGVDGHGRSGLNVWVPVPAEAAVVAALLERGWAVRPGESFRQRTPPAVRITISTLLPADAKRLAADLAEVLASRPGRSG